ncbi:MAG: hypothetical protein IJN63_04310 [Clostridia bacterium]|nr:hypothetical protein [Clostridia bacterium]
MKTKEFINKHLTDGLIGVLCITLAVMAAFIIAKTNGVDQKVDRVYSAVNAIIEDGETLFDEALFVVREKDGKVAIFDYRTGKVIEELNVYTYSLPQTDRTYLQNGIMIYTVSELISLIEDYTG